jgi:DnaK suppressor protein
MDSTSSVARKAANVPADDGSDSATGAVVSGVAMHLPHDYRPSTDEDFMNPMQRAYFRRKLLEWKESILRESSTTLETLKAEPLREPDVNDRASSETDWSIELRTRDRQRKVISKIDAALRRIASGDYGYCEVTGDPISLPRLEARPIATMTLEAQERHERAEKITRDE